MTNCPIRCTARSSCADCLVTAAVAAGAGFAPLVFELAAAPAWRRAAAVERVLFQPLGAAGVNASLWGRELVDVASLVAE